MNWDGVFKTIAAAIISVGGAGAIIAFIAKYASDRIAERMLRKYDAKLNKDLEQYKHDLEIETERYCRKSENLTFVTKKQFETEFSAYQAIFESLYDFSVRTTSLYPVFEHVPVDEQKKKEYYTGKYNEFCSAFNRFSEILEKNAPFIPKDIYEIFVTIRTHANDIAKMYPDIRIIDNPIFKADHREMELDNYQKTNDFKDEIEAAKEKIREYLSTLKVEA